MRRSFRTATHIVKTKRPLPPGTWKGYSSSSKVVGHCGFDRLWKWSTKGSKNVCSSSRGRSMQSLARKTSINRMSNRSPPIAKPNEIVSTRCVALSILGYREGLAALLSLVVYHQRGSIFRRSSRPGCNMSVLSTATEEGYEPLCQLQGQISRQ